jgi:hypothetical protein
MSPPIIPPARTPVPVDHLAAIPPDLTTRPMPPCRPCDDPLTCGITALCPPCQDVADWQAIRCAQLAERERLNSALREQEALYKHFPDLLADMQMRILAKSIGAIVAALIQESRCHG